MHRAVSEAQFEHAAARPRRVGLAFTSEARRTPGGSTSSMTLPSRDTATGTITIQVSPRLVSPGHFATLGLRVISGRPLAESDTATSQPVVVVNETFARRYRGGDVLGATVPMGIWGGSQTGTAAIIGVVEDIRYIGAASTTLPEMYFSHRQLPFGIRSSMGTLMVRTDGEPSVVGTTLRSAMRDATPTLVATPVMTLEDRLLLPSLARPRLYAVLLAAFPTVAAIVTGVGLFGVLSFVMSQRTRELGVRVALGARRIDLVTLVVRQGLGVALLGVIAGLLGAAWLARFLATLLYGVTHDSLTYLTVPAVLIVVAILACLAPALRAARLDPQRALRS